MLNPYHWVLGHNIFTQHSHMSPLHAVLRPFCHIYHPIGGIQVAPDRIWDPARRLIGCMFGSKTALFHLQNQVNWAHLKALVLLFQMRYRSLLSDKEMAGLRLVN